MSLEVGVEVVALGESAGAAVVWRVKGELRGTVVVKGRFAFVPDGGMSVAEAEEIFRGEVHQGKNPSRSVRVTGDLAPYLGKADVMLTGHACAPEGETALGMSVRLALFREGPLLDKSINVLCDRDGDVEEPFERMPLTYERAHGGIGFAENPFGVGVGHGSGKGPNLVDAVNPQKVACFAPIGKALTARRRLLGKTDRKLLEGAIAEIPDGFDFAYFQSAPADQQVGYLLGNEWVVLEGMHPVHTQICSALPSAAGRARVFGLGGSGAGRALALVADTLRIDADTLTCSVVWRGSFPVPDEAALAGLTIFTGVESAGRPIEWPAAPEPRVVAAVPGLEDDDNPLFATVVSGTAAERATSGQATSGQAPSGQATSGQASSPPPAARKDWDTTIELGDAPAVAAVPFRDGPANLPPPAPPASHRHEDLFSTTTILLSQRGEAPPTLPFARGEHAPPPRARPPEPAPARPAPMAAAPETVRLPDPGPGLALSPGLAPSPGLALSPGLTPSPELAPSLGLPPSLVAPTPRAGRARTEQGIEIVNDTPLTMGTLRWDVSPRRDCLTVFVKATADLVQDGPAALRAAEPPSDDRSLQGPRGSIRVYPSDFAPYKVRADVMLVGRAHAPPGGASSMTVRFQFGEANRGFDRTLLVFGDRTWEKTGALAKVSPPANFLQMPVRPDFAFGGAGTPNRAGLGVPIPGRKDLVSLPNIEDPRERLRIPRQSVPPAFFGPTPSRSGEPFPRDARPPSAAASAASARDSKSPSPADATSRSLPERFDWTRFQAAPSAQQTGFLLGDETFLVEGMHPQHPSFAGALPGVFARCVAERASGRRDEIPLLLDTVLFDLDDRTVTLVWRGALPVADERVPDVRSLRLVTVPSAKADSPLPD